MQLGNLWFARELWWHRSIMHVKVKINIVICCQFDMHFSPHFEIFWQSGHGSKSCRAPSAHFKGFAASDSGSTAKCRVPACILRPDDYPECPRQPTFSGVATRPDLSVLSTVWHDYPECPRQHTFSGETTRPDLSVISTVWHDYPECPRQPTFSGVTTRPELSVLSTVWHDYPECPRQPTFSGVAQLLVRLAQFVRQPFSQFLQIGVRRWHRHGQSLKDDHIRRYIKVPKRPANGRSTIRDDSIYLIAMVSLHVALCFLQFRFVNSDTDIGKMRPITITGPLKILITITLELLRLYTCNYDYIIILENGRNTTCQ